MNSQPGIAVAVFCRAGRIRFANDTAARIFCGGGTGEDLVGRSAGELFPEEWVDERMRLMTEVLDAGEPRLLRSIWRGYQHLSWITPVLTGGGALNGGGGDGVMVLIRRHAETPHDPDPISDASDALVAECNELGDLSVLTPRELEVLALIGQNLSTREIASHLHRATKTIENHRSAIGEKLGAPSRMQLSELARRAGLRFGDGRRTVVAVEADE